MMALKITIIIMLIIFWVLMYGCFCISGDCTREEEKEDENVEVNPSIRENVEANNGYCPCAIWQNPDTKCMCKDFRERESGLCHCGRFEKVRAEDGAKQD